MKKLKLEIDELAVESFTTRNDEALRGTVGGAATFFGTNGCYSCVGTICIESCRNTCDNSLDYCTCMCSNTCPEPTQYTGFCACDQTP